MNSKGIIDDEPSYNNKIDMIDQDTIFNTSSFKPEKKRFCYHLQVNNYVHLTDNKMIEADAASEQLSKSL